MELTAGLPVFGLSVVAMLWLARTSRNSALGRWLESEIFAGTACALIVIGMALGLMLVFNGADLYLHSRALDFAVCFALVAATTFLVVAMGRKSAASAMAPA